MNRSRLISLLLVLSMVLSMVVLPVAAEDAADGGVTEGTEAVPSAECPEHPGEAWTEVTAANWAEGAALTTGHYKLTENVDLTAALTVAAGETVCIDLAGFNITQTAAAYSTTANAAHQVFNVSGTLTVTDSAETDGVISGGWAVRRAGGAAVKGGNIYCAEGSVFNLYGGVISGGRVTSHGIGEDSTFGGNIYGIEATINIYGGTVTGGIADTNYSNSNTSANRKATVYGGNIAVFGGVLNISGGSITDGKADNNFVCQKSQGAFVAGGGNIFASTGAQVNISGGKITGGSATSDNKGIDVGENTTLSATARGGNIFVRSSATVINITGGTVSDGEAFASAAAYNEGTMTTTTVVAQGGNIAVVAGTVNLSGGKVTGGTAANGGNIFNAGELNISGGKVTGGEAHQGGAIYTSGTVAVSGNAAIADGVASAYDTEAKHWFRLNNGEAKTLEDGTVLEKVTSAGGNFYVEGGTVTVAGNATVTDGCTYYRGGNFWIAGGTVELRDNAAVAGGHNYFAKLGSSIDIAETETLPAVSGDVSAEWGGNFYNTGVLKVYDNAMIYGGIASRGGNYATGTKAGKLYLYGGAIFDGTGRREASNVRLHNIANVTLETYAGYIENVTDMGDSNVVTVYGGTLTSNMEITAACEKVHVSGNHYWHADGTCATCGHTYAAAGADTACETCGGVHETTGGAHTYVDGVCSVCGYAMTEASYDYCGCQNANWTAWDGVTLEDGGHYYLTDDLQLTAEIAPAFTNGTVCIYLNEYTLTANPGSRAITLTKDSYVTLNLYDGTIQSGGAINNDEGGLAFVGANTGLCAYGVTFTGGQTAHAQAGGNIYARGEVHLYDCVLKDGKIHNNGSTNGGDGGNIALYTEDGYLWAVNTRFMDGDVSLTKNSFGGNIYNTQDTTMILEECEVTGGRARTGGNIYLMNSTAGGVSYYIDTVVKDAHTDSDYDMFVYGSASYISNVYIFGGHFDEIKDNGNMNEVMIFNGTFGFDVRTANYDGTSMAGECACASYDEETGICTVSHATAEYCEFCNGYTVVSGCEYEYVGGHTYNEGETLCANCSLATANVGEALYTDLATAMAVAEQTGETVVLLRNVYVGDLDVYCALDLNGWTLNSTGIVDASTSLAAIMDTMGTGSVKAGEVKMYAYNGNSGYLAYVDSDGVYTYESVSATQKLEQTDATTKYLQFIIDDAADETILDDILINGDEFQVRITVTWNGGADTHHFYYNTDLVKAYGRDDNGNSIWGEKMFTCTINGLDLIGEHTITAEIVSGGIAVAAADYVAE